MGLDLNLHRMRRAARQPLIFKSPILLCNGILNTAYNRRMFPLKALVIPASCVVLFASGPTQPPPVQPPVPLQAGESLVLTAPDGQCAAFGEAEKPSNMGGLAKLLWLNLDGDEWSAMDVQFRCKGEMQGVKCSCPKGHGKVDLSSALKEDCHLAVYAWAQMSLARNNRIYGEGAQSLRMKEAFGPFLDKAYRWPVGALAITPEWVGQGELLRTSPKALMQWLTEARQELLLLRCRRHLQGYIQRYYRNDDWWTFATQSQSQAKEHTWVLGGNGVLLAVLRMDAAKDQKSAVERFKQVLGIK